MTRLHQLADLLLALQGAQAEAIAEGLIEAAGESTSARNGLMSRVVPENHKPASAEA